MQSVIVLLVGGAWVCASSDSHWLYFKTGFIFAFAFDFMLACSCIFTWSQYTSYESSYSWMLALLSFILVVGESFVYYHLVSPNRKKVQPAA